MRELKAQLPPTARSLYFKDAIGNISTSHTRFGLSHTEVDLRPRYPIFGGWRVKVCDCFACCCVWLDTVQAS